MSYATKLAIDVEFKGKIGACNTSEGAKTNCFNLLHSNGQKSDLFWVGILCLFAIFLIGRVLAGRILNAKAKSFY